MEENFDTVFFGPMIGELGWTLSRWQGFCRFRTEGDFKDKKIIVSGYPGTQVLYRDFATEFISLPQWFLDQKYEVDSYDAVDVSAKDYARLMDHFTQFYDVAKTKTIRTPRGCTTILSSLCQQKVIKLEGTESARRKRDLFLNGETSYVIISARGRTRAAHRNWPEASWSRLVDLIEETYPDLTLVLCGAPSGSFLKYREGKKIINIIYTPAEESIDLSLAFLEKALFSVTTQSGSTHLSLQARCPSFVMGHEQQRHMVDENYLKTTCMFLTNERYDAKPEDVFDFFCKFYNSCKERRSTGGEQ